MDKSEPSFYIKKLIVSIYCFINYVIQRLVIGDIMSSEYLHYLASVSQHGRRKRQNNRLKSKHFKSIDSQRNFKKSPKIYDPKKSRIMDNPPENVKSILVGESDPEILHMLEVYLNSMGYNYVSVSSGDKVLDHVFNNNSVKKEKYDIVLLDTHLKKMSGLTVANEIRKRNLHQRIIIMSTTPKEQLPYELIKSARIHDNDVFTKPFRLAELLCSIER